MSEVATENEAGLYGIPTSLLHIYPLIYLDIAVLDNDVVRYRKVKKKGELDS